MTSFPSSTQATQRISAISKHLSSPSSAATTMSTTPKPPITCHILDTTLGRPGPNIPVTLTLHNPPSSLVPANEPLKYTATTNSDGRVTSWTPSSPFSSDNLHVIFKRDGDQKYSLTFDTEAYFAERGIETFFPEVEVKFVVREKSEHYHVPVLLGPFGYTTYRGS